MEGENLPLEIHMGWDSDDQVWVTKVSCLNHLSTFGKTYSEALEITREAISLYLEVALEEGDPLPFTNEQARELLSQLAPQQ